MRISFLVTTCNIAPYVGRCLDSVAACARAGDEIVVIDDGSIDGTAERVLGFGARLAADHGDSVGYAPVCLGTNTPGGVGIPANLALARATGEAVFFVDGDDWLDAAGFAAARARFEAGSDEVLIANYLEYDEAAGSTRSPADRARWAGLATANSAEARRLLALSMIAVPWRKFYRRSLLERHAIRFPEGDFFYEDNPFHWQVCLKAESIGFHDRVLCYHRVNRPGQTMMAQGAELAAFFTHYRSIRALLPAEADTQAPALAGAAMRWLLANMAWHLRRLRPSAFWDYAAAAQPVLQGCDAALWEAEVAPAFAGSPVGRAAEQLRSLPLASVVALWLAERQAAETEALRCRLDRALDILEGLEADRATLTSAAAQVSALAALEEFRALAALSAAPPPSPQRGGGAQATETPPAPPRPGPE